MNDRFNLEYLNTFLIAAETGKFNITAELVYRSHSSVSTQIKKLEQQIGAPLFIRNKKDNVTLTKAGETLYDYAQKILDLNDRAFRSIKNSNWKGSLSFGLPTDYTKFFLNSIYPELLRSYPDFTFETICSRSRKLRDQIAEGRVSIAIVAMEPQFSEDIFLWSEKLYWVSSKEFNFQNLDKLPVALFSDNCIVNNHSLYCLKRAKKNFEVVFTSTMLENIAECVKNNIAVSLLPESLIDDDFQIIPENFISCPYKLNFGLTWEENADLDMVENIASTIRNSFRLLFLTNSTI
ncbi:hypothetical protein I588_00803 [Enterococcus pallens ATCC BAA-351]|uniref:HTH lysR-type domain-containing protein n=2 Tax=Enterococcus pallens TaxID=160454 RepID=R2SBY6_9ENTE|nr:hypothetical protein UAU_02672 [Enterococcus pallens ATCC BAA-351]EOU24816.1 hypothetical protein I588_00803 [Enterococcus pallens ATCC BAA-351]